MRTLLSSLGQTGSPSLKISPLQIHDSDMLCDHPLEHYINGPAHHTLHHLYFTCNYGQYFTWADKAFSSFRVPAKGDDPLVAVLAGLDQKKRKQEKVAVPPEMKRIDSGLGSEVEPESPSSSTASGQSSANSSDREQSVDEDRTAGEAGVEGAQRRRRSTRASMAAATAADQDTPASPTRPVRREGLRARK